MPDDEEAQVEEKEAPPVEMVGPPGRVMVPAQEVQNRKNQGWDEAPSLQDLGE